MKKININTQSRSYDVNIGKNILTQMISVLKESDGEVLFICDKNVYDLHREKIISLTDSRKHHLYLFNSSERNKTLKSVELIYKYLKKHNFSRTDKIVAIGGGIVGDITGYVAATYMRGIQYYQVPTTLLSMVDSSVGGKTGVNFLNVKNLIGSFHQPEKVYIDLAFLSTLPDREIISGAGEIFKYAFLSDEENYLIIRDYLLKILLQRKFHENMISRCIQFKASVVEKDEFEKSGLRKILNLGHTFAHGFESALRFKIKHGEAVIAGVFCSLIISKKIGLITDLELHKFASDFEFLPVNTKVFRVDTENIIRYMKSDKKTSGNRIKLVLVSKPGNVFIDVEVTEKLIKESVVELSELFESV